ncbi:MAG: protoheme IX farnesyltransferase [Candidatus Omnitrophica bacterium]|nr:protoheme IX farnesyltransferase [Candidatus Omnitrophota bacterium]
MHRFAQLTALATFILLIAGGLVTSTDSGLAVPDWPLSYGTLFPPMVGGIRYEHTHRVIAGIVALMIGALAMWLRVREPRRWVRRLGYGALAAVVTQAVLGGLTVLFLLPPMISVAHACLGPLVFSTLACLAVTLSPTWSEKRLDISPPRSMRVMSLGLVGMTVFQLLVGAVLRHAGHALWLHLVGAVLLTMLMMRLWWHTRRQQSTRHLVTGLVMLLGAQLALGFLAWGHRDHVLMTTAHQAIGALVLALACVLVLKIWRGAARDTIYEIRNTLKAYWNLTKPRVTMMGLLTTAVGFLMGSTIFTDAWRLLPTLLGAWWVGSGANALNQWYEREADALMERTKGRPLPSGRLRPWQALVFGVATAAMGLGCLWLFVNTLSTWCAAATLVIYLNVYTPMKRRSSLCTLVGAIPGALPPLIGWTAASGSLSLEAWVLCAMLFLWQLPHFLAIAWVHRDDYRRAGFRMLSVVDPSGQSTSRQMMLSGFALLVTSLLPSVLGVTGALYFLAALGMGSWLLLTAWRAALGHSDAGAQRLFLASIGYLPLVLFIMVVDKTLL